MALSDKPARAPAAWPIRRIWVFCCTAIAQGQWLYLRYQPKRTIMRNKLSARAVNKNVALLNAGVCPAALGKKRATIVHKNKKKVEKHKWAWELHA